MHRILTVLLTATVLAACSPEPTSTSTPDSGSAGQAPSTTSSILTPSSGGMDEALVVMTEDFMAAHADSVLADLNQPYLLLPQFQPRVRLSSVGHDAFDAFLKRLRNIVLVAPMAADDPITAFVRDRVDDATFEALRSGEQNVVYLGAVWAQPQMVVVVTGPDATATLRAVEANATPILNRFAANDRSEYREIAFMAGVNHTLDEQLRSTYGFSLEIPLDYAVAKNEPGFIFLRKDMPNAILNLFVHVRPDDAPSVAEDRTLAIREELGRSVQAAGASDTRMTTDTLFGPEQRLVTMDGARAIETRGLFRMVGAFKGGPFLSYYIPDPDGARSIYIEGHLYGPGVENKRHIMRQFEAILSTFRWVGE